MNEEIQIALRKFFGEQVGVDFKDEKGDGKHFYLNIESEKFKGLSRLEQSRMVYSVLDPYMKTGYIHALRMKCNIPNN